MATTVSHMHNCNNHEGFNYFGLASLKMAHLAYYNRVEANLDLKTLFFFRLNQYAFHTDRWSLKVKRHAIRAEKTIFSPVNHWRASSVTLACINQQVTIGILLTDAWCIATIYVAAIAHPNVTPYYIYCAACFSNNWAKLLVSFFLCSLRELKLKEMINNEQRFLVL